MLSSKYIVRTDRRFAGTSVREYLTLLTSRVCAARIKTNGVAGRDADARLFASGFRIAIRLKNASSFEATILFARGEFYQSVILFAKYVSDIVLPLHEGLSIHYF